MSLKKALIISIIILIIDQLSKIYIKTHFALGDEILVFDWFRIHFIENEGMAWGMKLPGDYGKLILTLFRIFAVWMLFSWLKTSVKQRKSKYLILSIALIIAGAVGNIIDSVFYGVIFDHSHNQIATMFASEPYGKWFHGKVVDMFYFPIWHGNLPEFLGGKPFTFFNAIFNVADASITIGVIIMLIFNKHIFGKK